MKARHQLESAHCVLLMTVGTASAADLPLKKVDGILADAAGKTVYTFDKDVTNSGTSACNGQCAALWPPVAAGADQPAAPYSVVIRDDGTRQLAYKGKPLYLYAADQKAGERKGDNFKDIWHVVKD